MRDLWPFIKLHFHHTGPILLGILLSFLTLLASLGLLSVSGWFITSTALSGLSVATAQAFNFFTPGAMVRGFSIARIAFRYFERVVSHDATFKLLSWLRGWFFQKLTPLSHARYRALRQGDLLNRLVSDVDALDQLYLRLFSPLVSAVLTTGIVVSGLSLLHTQLALLVGGLMVSWLVILPVLFYASGHHSSQQLGLRQRALRQVCIDYLQGMAESLIYGSEKTIYSAFKKTTTELYQSQQRMANGEAMGGALLAFASGSTVVSLLWFGAGAFEVGEISAPVMVLFLFAVLASFEAFMPIPAAFQLLGYTRQAAQRLNEILEQEPVAFGSYQPETVAGCIRFENIHYQYADAEFNVIEQLNLSISAGEHMALLGKTGCGKSTLLRLLTRELGAREGAVFIDDKPVEDYTEESLYRSLAVVPQTTRVLSDTFRDNLRLALPAATDEQLLAVVEQTGLMSLAGGNAQNNVLDIRLGEGGVALSGGEQRRLSIARVLLKQAPILVMDEPSEGLDPVSERALLNEVLDAYRDRTVVMITHKSVVLERMDRVCLMEELQKR